MRALSHDIHSKPVAMVLKVSAPAEDLRGGAEDFSLLALLTATFLGGGYLLLWEPVLSRWIF